MSRVLTIDVPTGVTAYQLRTDRGSFAVLDASPPSGTRRGTALLLPGFTGSKEDFLPLLAPLARAGFRAVAIDGRGQYESAGPREESAYVQRELARDVAAQSAALADGGPLHLLGHSLGGLIARAAVLDAAPAPLPWDSLTLMNCGPAAIEAAQQVRTGMLIDALGGMGMADIWQVMRSMEKDGTATDGSAAAPGTAAAEVDAFHHRRWMATVPEQLIVTGRQLIAEPDRVDELAAAALRTLVVSGAADPTWPVPWQDEMARRLGAERVVVEGGGHSPNVHRPAQTAEALAAFWSR
ncbi:alpha/beta fold hydrolase [Streptomyces sp. NPDC048650]|uniref:alpha/beta fold hydrolase n=1 Tax=unclassified Streptomyces TaxID=2593676 RepID=UPI00371A3072